MSTQLQSLLKRLDEIVDGIDRDECDGGWWETEKGVELGKTTLRELRQLVTEAAQSAEARAAELLQRQALVPVSISERLPGPGDCDAEGKCWWFEADEDCDYGSNWTLLCIRGSTTCYTHWLPAHALPLPEVGE